MPAINVDDFVFAFDLPAEDAIKYLSDKGYAINWDWRETLDEAHARSFTVAKVMQLDILTDIRNELERAQRDGRTFKEFADELEPRLSEKGWWGKKYQTNPETGEKEFVQLGSISRLENIFRTNMQSAYMAGRLAQQIETIDRRPYVRFIATRDRRTTDRCRNLHGIVFRLDDAKMLRVYPPNHYRCRSRTQTVSEAEFQRKGFELTKASDLAKDQKPLEGFNAPPSVAWKPDMRKYRPDLAKEYERATKNGPPPIKKKVTARNVGKIIRGE